jgi:hypothetical protein
MSAVMDVRASIDIGATGNLVHSIPRMPHEVVWRQGRQMRDGIHILRKRADENAQKKELMPSIVRDPAWRQRTAVMILSERSSEFMSNHPIAPLIHQVGAFNHHTLSLAVFLLVDVSLFDSIIH